jgi:hypothetical protein
MDHPDSVARAPQPESHSGAGKPHRLIFCINSGRAGSEYLMHILGTAKNVSAFHEPEPTMSTKYLSVVMKKSLAATKEERRVKVDAIQKFLADSPPGQIYAETSNMFIKTFYDVVMDSFPREQIYVVILRRDLAKVLKSFISLGYFAEPEDGWHDWMYRVPSALSIIRPPMPYEQMDMYDRTISYLIDIEAHAQAFKDKYPDCAISEVFLEQLQNMESVTCFFQQLKIEPTAETAKVVGTRINERKHRKDKMKVDTSDAYCRERIRNYVLLCQEHGIKLPDLIQFNDSAEAEDESGAIGRIRTFFSKIIR